MPNAERAVPPVSLVVRWPNRVSPSLAEQVHRRLAEARIGSTWAIEDPAQTKSLQSKHLRTTALDIALLVTAEPGKPSVEALERGLDQFHSTGLDIVAIQVACSFARGSVERRLCQSGVRSVIVGAIRAESSIVRTLPFGVWEFSPHLSAPPTRRWPRLFGGAEQRLEFSDASPVVASIDLGRVRPENGRGWRAVERLIEQVADASASGAARIVTIAEVAAELSEMTASRPQRSILRAA